MINEIKICRSANLKRLRRIEAILVQKWEVELEPNSKEWLSMTIIVEKGWFLCVS